jgi:hypothetical protein
MALDHSVGDRLGTKLLTKGDIKMIYRFFLTITAILATNATADFVHPPASIETKLVCEGSDSSKAVYRAVISRSVESALSVKILRADDQGNFSLLHEFNTLRLVGTSDSWFGYQSFRKEGNMWVTDLDLDLEYWNERMYSGNVWVNLPDLKRNIYVRCPRG